MKCDKINMLKGSQFTENRMFYDRKPFQNCLHIILLFIILHSPFSVLHSIAQTDSVFELSKTIKGSFENFTVDNLGNYFLLDKNNQLKKLNNNGDSVGVFNDVKRFGKLYSIDATNPLKILLYYKDYNTVVVLDRFLNNVNTIDLRKAGIFQAGTIALSYDNYIWVYDEAESKLKKVNDEGQVNFESTDLRMVMDTVPLPLKIVDRDNFVYLYDPGQGLLVFDYYGTLKNKLAFLQLRDVQVLEKTMMGRKDGELVVYQLGSLNLREYKLPDAFAGSEKIKINTNAIYVLKEDGVRCYRIK